MDELKVVSPIKKFTWSNQKKAKLELPNVDNSSSKPEKNFIQMGNKIKASRLKHNLTQDDLAKLVDCSTGYISSLERGKQGASDDILFALEKSLQLEHKSLLKLRDMQITDAFQQLEANSATDQYPDFLKKFVETLLSFGDEYAKQKVLYWLKELQDDYFNRLIPFELKEVKRQVIAVKRNWVNNKKGNEILEERESHIVHGYIMQDEQKHVFSLQLDEYALTLTLLHKDRQQVKYFESWLGTCCVGYMTTGKLPYSEEEEKMSCYLWFNPNVSIANLYRYLNELDINIHNMDVNEPRLNWYIHELTIESESNIAQ